ncbi:MAG: hypothetical protein SGILL_000284 [Bacillariaceae sp.]
MANGQNVQNDSPPPKKATKGLPFPEMQAASSPKTERDADGNLISVTTKLNYVTPDTFEINVHRDVSGVDDGYEGASWDVVELSVKNGRLAESPKTLDEHGYQLIEKVEGGNPTTRVDFMNTNDVIDDYYPECEKTLKKILGEDKIAEVKAFDHNIRINTSSFGEELKGGGGSKAQVPLGMVHGDYTNVSAPRRIQDLAEPPKANDVLKRRLGEQPLLQPNMVEEAIQGKRRFAIINVWRNIDQSSPVLELPLACMDSSCVSQEDFKVLKIHYQDRVGQNYFLSHAKAHDWYYFPQMTIEEALLIKTWDSKGSFALTGNNEISSQSTLAFHTAFLDPISPENSPPRKSIEVRCVVMWNSDE